MYAGAAPLSEPETAALHRHLDSLQPGSVLAAVSVHSYGRDIYYPKVGHDRTVVRLGSAVQGWLAANHPDQLAGRQLAWLRDFAKHFNRALGFRCVCAVGWFDA